MKRLLALFTFVLISITTSAQTYNSFKPGVKWLDNNGVAINAHGGGLLYHNGTYYWYGEHKIEGKAGNTAMVGVHCYSSKDLYNWKDEGISLDVSDDENSDITRGCILERPKVVYNKKTGKFVMWFHLELKGKGYLEARSGVAVADSPTAKFRFIESGNPNSGCWPEGYEENLKVIPKDKESEKQNYVGRDFEKGQMARDMTIYVDDNQKAYHIYSSEENSTTQIAELSDDYLKHTGKYTRIFERRWMEAPAVFKHHGNYYFIGSGCTGWAPNSARSGVANDIMGSWSELDNPCSGTNPHNNLNGELTFGGQSTYILKVEGKKDAYIALFDIWNPENPIDGLYVWLPIKLNPKDKSYMIEWHDEWDLSIFDK